MKPITSFIIGAITTLIWNAAMILAIAGLFAMLSCKTIKNTECVSQRYVEVTVIKGNAYTTLHIPYCDTVRIKTKGDKMPGGTADPQAAGGGTATGLSNALPIAGQIVDTATGSLASILAGKRNRKFAREMYWTQRNAALADWNMQNEYNSPAAQMARLKEAGLNPNLVYGNGGSQVQAATVRSSDMTMGNEQPMTGTNIGRTMGEYQNIKLANAALTSQKLLQEKTRAETAATLTGAAKTASEINLNKFNLDQSRNMQQQIFEELSQRVQLLKGQNDLQNNDIRVSNATVGDRIKQIKLLNTTAEVNNAKTFLQNTMQQMENGQYRIMRPTELAIKHKQLEYLQLQIRQTMSQSLSEDQRRELEALNNDLNQAMKLFQSAVPDIHTNINRRR